MVLPASVFASDISVLCLHFPAAKMQSQTIEALQEWQNKMLMQRADWNCNQVCDKKVSTTG
jgi:hypothetical protein